MGSSARAVAPEHPSVAHGGNALATGRDDVDVAVEVEVHGDHGAGIRVGPLVDDFSHHAARVVPSDLTALRGRRQDIQRAVAVDVRAVDREGLAGGPRIDRHRREALRSVVLRPRDAVLALRGPRDVDGAVGVHVDPVDRRRVQARGLKDYVGLERSRAQRLEPFDLVDVRGEDVDVRVAVDLRGDHPRAVGRTARVFRDVRDSRKLEGRLVTRPAKSTSIAKIDGTCSTDDTSFAAENDSEPSFEYQ